MCGMNYKLLTFKILPELKLIIEYFAGPINLADVMHFKLRLVQHPQYDERHNILAVMVDTEIKEIDPGMARQQITKYVDFVKFTPKVSGNRRSTLLVSTKNQVIIGSLYESWGKKLDMDFKTVGTLPAALNWLGMNPAQEGKIACIIDEMSKQYQQRILI